ncbi:nucleotidyltransferase family protein [Pelagicoccus sp. SDUM812002]|uniref:nucleotidyltransferase family protein n=1 Tax=Pelagicoccus sp. SDUM812002 TaxID=3041266 RepID=UPI002810759A|nr:nucleotidyltransferase family protein [Pelagicoccus sp. SDUM812002]MDQ8186333.1 nucleotidyltransferase family protein [Pelagicoccus sp. SDUM812002]
MEKYSKIGCVLLAAGTSSRFGAKNKLLSEIDGVPMIRKVLAALQVEEVDFHVVVLGHESELVLTALEGCVVDVVVNPEYARGMGGSLALGAKRIVELGGSCMLVCLADLPHLRKEDVSKVANAFRAEDCEQITYPVVGGQHGHPVCFPGRSLADLGELEGEMGARRVIDQDPLPRVEVSGVGSGCIQDLDHS